MKRDGICPCSTSRSSVARAWALYARDHGFDPTGRTGPWTPPRTPNCDSCSGRSSTRIGIRKGDDWPDLVRNYANGQPAAELEATAAEVDRLLADFHDDVALSHLLYRELWCEYDPRPDLGGPTVRAWLGQIAAFLASEQSARTYRCTGPGHVTCYPLLTGRPCALLVLRPGRWRVIRRRIRGQCRACRRVVPGCRTARTNARERLGAACGHIYPLVQHVAAIELAKRWPADLPEQSIRELFETLTREEYKEPSPIEEEYACDLNGGWRRVSGPRHRSPDFAVPWVRAGGILASPTCWSSGALTPSSTNWARPCSPWLSQLRRWCKSRASDGRPTSSTGSVFA